MPVRRAGDTGDDDRISALSPVAPSTGHAGRALLVSAVSIVAIMSLLFLAAVAYGRQNSPTVRLGDATFQGGSTKRLAKAIAKGGPIIYTDVSGSADRDIILQHLGPDRATRWFAFRAQPPSKGRACTWDWKPKETLFRAKCDPELTAPADGKGLESYPVSVTNGRLDIDLNASERTTTTSTPATTTTIPVSGRPKGD